jgi:HNH endonuclease
VSSVTLRRSLESTATICWRVGSERAANIRRRALKSTPSMVAFRFRVDTFICLDILTQGLVRVNGKKECAAVRERSAIARTGDGESVSAWANRRRRSARFEKRIRLVTGAGERLVQLAELLSLLSRGDGCHGRSLQPDAHPGFPARGVPLFGAMRVSLDKVRQPLREFQENRCFYCETPIRGPAEVDHFIPWARHPDDGIGNLVAADARCNNDKRDFVASTEHLQSVPRHTARRCSRSLSS